MTNTLWRATVAVLFLLLLGATAVLATQNSRLARDNRALHDRATRPYAGLVVPEALALTMGGDSVTLGAAHHGERQLLFFFTTTCGFCRSAIPSWSAIAQSVTQQHNVRVYAVVLDTTDSLATYAEHAGLSIPIVAPVDSRFPFLYRSKAVPLTMVIGESGRVLYSRFGVMDSLVHLDSIVTALGKIHPVASTSP